MTYFLHDDVVDLALNHLKNNVTRIVLCDGAPTNYSDAVTNNGSGTGRKLAESTVDDTHFTLANDATNGRKLTAAARIGLAVVANGDGTHVAWVDVANTKLLKVVPVPTPVTGLTTVATVTIPEHFHVFRDAAAIA